MSTARGVHFSVLTVNFVLRLCPLLYAHPRCLLLGLRSGPLGRMEELLALTLQVGAGVCADMATTEN